MCMKNRACLLSSRRTKRTRCSGKVCAVMMYAIFIPATISSFPLRVTRRSYAPAAPALVLLTATITPPAGVPALSRTDPGDRLDDYRRALAFYLGLPGAVLDRVVFAENSESELRPIRAVAERFGAGKDVEFLSFYGLDYPVEHGRAVGEMRLIETALSRSRLLSGLGDNDMFWKITGRLRVKNLGQLVATAPADSALYADFRRFPRPWIDLRVFACRPPGFRGLFLSRVEQMRQDELASAGFTAPEERLFGELLPERSERRIVPRLRREPMIEGYSGFGQNYSRPTRRLWSNVRGASRRICPGLWL